MKRRRVSTRAEEIGRKEGDDEEWQGPRARSHPYHTSSFLVVYQLKGNRRREGKEK